MKPDNPDCTTCGLSPKNCICSGSIESAFPNEKTMGMSLRDYAAIHAMQGFLSDVRTLSIIHIQGELKSLTPAESVSKAAYKIADAMLKERIK